MSRRGSARLELTWPNKDRRLLSHGSDTYEWVDSSDWRVSEIRLLHETAAHGSDADENLLIQGDALHALNSLVHLPEYAEKYVGQVKLVYIDPPFNTGQAFAHYDDGVEHSVWLTMLRDRLIQIKKLLRPDGSVWVHLDDVEVHRARSVLDEVLGADNFVATVIWEKRYSRSNDASAFSVSHDYILVYAKASSRWSESRNRLPRRASDEPNYRNADGDPLGPWRGIPFDAPGTRGPSLSYGITAPDGSVKYPPKGRHWSSTEDSWQKTVDDGRAYFGKSGSAMPSVKRYLSEMPGLVPFTLWKHTEVGHNDGAKRALSSAFPDADAFDTPKPEALLDRIIKVASNPGDIVLDCFAGSGTTAAVAHKLGRSWVTVELSPGNIETFVRPRLLSVIAGTDEVGVNESTETEFIGDLPEGMDFQQVKQAAEVLAPLFEYGTFNELPKVPKKDAAGPLGQLVSFLRDHPDAYEALIMNMAKQMRAAAKTKKVTTKLWGGGGGFTELTVGPSMFEDVDGIVVLSDWAVGGELAEAVAAQVGFEYAPDGPFAGRKGKTRLAVIDGMLTTSIVDYLVGHLDDGERLRVVAQALDPDADAYLKAKRSGSRAQKVPRDLARQGRRPSRLVRLDAEATTGDGEKA